MITLIPTNHFSLGKAWTLDCEFSNFLYRVPVNELNANPTFNYEDTFIKNPTSTRLNFEGTARGAKRIPLAALAVMHAGCTVKITVSEEANESEFTDAEARALCDFCTFTVLGGLLLALLRNIFFR